MKICNSEIRLNNKDWFRSFISTLILFIILSFNNQVLAESTTSNQQPATSNQQPATSSQQPESDLTVSDHINNVFTPIVDVMVDILFWDPFAWAGIYDDKVYDENGEQVFNDEGEAVTAPLKLIVLWLIFGGLVK